MIADNSARFVKVAGGNCVISSCSSKPPNAAIPALTQE